MSVRVKICGVTNRADAEMAIAAGADALGFNLFPGSKRFVDLAAEASWIRTLPPLVERIAIMVNPAMAEVDAVLREPGIDRIQFHGDESPEFLAPLADRGVGFLKAIAASGVVALRELARFRASGIVLDAFVPGEYGGTGKLIDLALASECAGLNAGIPIVLSGGLDPGNVGEAVVRVRPYAVDVASGVEMAGDPRRKDPARVRTFVKAARGAS